VLAEDVLRRGENSFARFPTSTPLLRLSG
jgi:hypothetical protein